MPTTPATTLDPELVETVEETLSALRWKHVTLQQTAQNPQTAAYHAMRAANLEYAEKVIRQSDSLAHSARALVSILLKRPDANPGDKENDTDPETVSAPFDESQEGGGEGE